MRQDFERFDLLKELLLDHVPMQGDQPGDIHTDKTKMTFAQFEVIFNKVSEGVDATQ